jgi:DNA-binding transcriptional regulator YdaS (Cro superfamily)
MSNDALKRAIEVMGGQAAMARSLAERTGKPIRQGHIWAWLNRTNKVPPELAPHIESATAALDRCVRREELCPEFPWGESISVNRENAA